MFTYDNTYTIILSNTSKIPNKCMLEIKTFKSKSYVPAMIVFHCSCNLFWCPNHYNKHLISEAHNIQHGPTLIVFQALGGN